MQTVAVVRRVLNAAGVTPPVWRCVGELYSSGVTSRLEWRGSVLTGDADALRDVQELVHEGRPVGITPTGPWVPADPHDELCAYVLALNVLRGADVTGAPPDLPIPELPAGAIP